MEGLLVYILKVCLAGSVMVLVYRLVFRHERLFHLNRMYLLAAVLIPWTLPLVTLKEHVVRPAAPVQADNMLASVYALSGGGQAGSAARADLLPVLLLYLYAAGLFFFLLQLLLSFIRIRGIIRRCSHEELSGRKVYITHTDLVPFSFLNKIVISEKVKNHPRLRLMLDHEKIHVQQWHTIDIISAEVFRALLWFSPFAWMLARDLKTNLEYIADAGVTGNGRNMAAYQATLVNLAAGFTPLPLTNSFNYTQLKKRMIMMTKTLHTRKSAWKYLLVLPLLTGLFFTFCSKESIYDLGEEGLTVTGKVTDAGTHTPLSGVVVVTNDRQTGAVTNENGSYRITLTHPEDTLQFQTENGQVVSVLPAGRNKVDVSLDTGGGIRIRGVGNMTGVQPLYYVDGVRVDYEAINQIDPKDIESVQVLKNSDAAVEYAGTEEARERGVVIIVTKGASSEIKGALPESGTKMSDITVTGYGSPAEAEVDAQSKAGEQTTVRVRGYSTASGSDPIYVVDGIPYFGGLPELDPNDIESVQVLKDASAYAFMGTEEGRQRGVVVIATKGLSLEPGIVGIGSPRSGSNGPVLLRQAAEEAATGEEPIIMLDGKNHEGGMGSIDPNTIESVQVLKGDQAFERIGMEEARQNGVILVTSKEPE